MTIEFFEQLYQMCLTPEIIEQIENTLQMCLI